MTSSSQPVLTTADIDWSTVLPDAVRVFDWSPKGRLLAIAADGSALVGGPERITSPMTPDPRDATWLGERALAVVDPVVGLVTAGLNSDQPLPFWGARRVGTHGGRTVISGDGRLAVLGHPGINRVPEVIWTGIGVTHACFHVGGAMWALGGTKGLALIDVALGCVDTRVELSGVIAIAARGDAGRLVASDLAGAIHVFELSDLDTGVELTGYCDPVRLLAMSPDGRRVIAAAADELTHWVISDNGSVADEPISIVAHDSTITALESSDSGFLATGDESGVVYVWSPLLAEHPVARLQLDGEVTALAWSRDGTRLAIGSVSGELVVADVRAGALA
jgi:WD40 repeat protein